MSGVATPPPAATGTATVSTGPRESASLGQARIIAMPERPAAEAQAGRGLTLTGTVISQDKDGTATIRTAAGDVTVKTDTKLPTDKPITLQIPPSQGKSTGLLLANLSSLLPTLPEATAGKPASPLIQTPTTPPQNAASQAQGNAGGVLVQTTPSAPNIAVRPGVILQATVASNTPAAPAPAATPPTLLPQTATAPTAPLAGSPSAPQMQAALPAPAPAAGAAAPAAASPTPAQLTPTNIGAVPPTAAPAASTPAPTAPTPTAPPPTVPPSGSLPAPTAAGATPPPAPQLAGQAAASSLPTAPPTGTSAPSTATPTATLPASGSALPVRVLTVTPPGTAPQPLPPIPPGFTVLSGTIESTLSTGQPVLVSNQGVLVLNTRAAVPPGTGVTIAMASEAAGKPSGPASPTGAAPLPLPPTTLATAALTSPKGIDWPALSRGFEMLAATNPTAADALRETTMPRPNARLGSAMLGMMAALKRGDIGSWLGGGAMDVIARQGAGVARQLAADFASLRHTARDVGGDEWRGYTLPMEMPGGAITPVQLHIRAQQHDDEAQDDDANRRDGGVRFVIDLHLTQLGPVQIEGLARSQDHRLDMIMRTRDALPAEMRGDLQQLYNAALQATAQAGGLIFQRGEQGWLRLARQRAGDPLGLQA